MSFSTSDTVVAVATPSGRGGIGVVRLSGPAAHEIARQLIGRREPLVARHATFARVIDRDNAPMRAQSRDNPPSQRDRARVIDEVVVTLFAAPQSYTGDDVVELSAHGSPLLLQRIVEAAMAAGARLAEPGEFTLRAYLNGRLDLVQAEAVGDLVNAVTPVQARAAMDQLEGTLTGEIAAADAALFDLAARLEASLDFPEEGFHFLTRDEAAGELDAVGERLTALLRHARAGRVVREGRMVVIVGRPNAGKSSLFNALLGSARAIVTDIPGTTRDALTERVDFAGIPVTLVDTAGLRDSKDPIEAEGVARTRQAQTVAALLLVVVDGSQPLTDDDRALVAAGATPRVVAISKADLPRPWSRDREFGPDDDASVAVSAKTGHGLDQLRGKIVAALTAGDELRDTPAITNARHIALVSSALECIDRVKAALVAGATEELLLADLASARRALEEVTGRRTDEDLLRHIFATFCIGK